MALDIFLKLGDVKGESADKTHRKEIDAINWSWGIDKRWVGPGRQWCRLGQG